MFCVYLKGMDILQLVGIVFSVCQLGQGVDVVLAFCTVTLALLIAERGLLKSPTKIVDLSIFSFQFLSDFLQVF